MINKLEVFLTESMFTSMNICHFTNVTKLHLHVDEIVSIGSLSKLINLCQLIHVELESCHFNRDNQRHLCEILTLLQQSSKLAILTINSLYSQSKIYPYLQSIMSILPHEINHLKIPIEKAKQLEMILELCQRLNVLQISTDPRKFPTEFTEWFEEKTDGSISRRTFQCETIWIGKMKQMNSFNQKRIKLNEEF